MANHQHLIAKGDLRATSWNAAPGAALDADQVRLKLDAFALTANNVTYAAFGGPPMNYWNFFPAGDEAHGRVPVWGFATVEASNCAGIEPGQRVYGYFPISETLDVTAGRLSDRGFMDVSPHRVELAPVYNTYLFAANDPAYDAAFEPQQMLFRPLYATGWMICDSLMEGGPKPEQVLISSASSKTALATAHGLKSRGVEAIGLTSAGNKAFVEGGGLYTKVLTYDQAPAFQAAGAAAYVDFVGRPALTKDVHTACGDKLVRSMVIGVTDWEGDRTPPAELPGPEPEFFFVPDYAAQRAKALPPGELDRRMTADLTAFYPASKAFVTAETIQGRDAIAKAWLDTVEGDIAPSRGLICSF
ncbi:MAG: DUF2855 family protein [Pseudomonadota bacterium]